MAQAFHPLSGKRANTPKTPLAGIGRYTRLNKGGGVWGGNKNRDAIMYNSLYEGGRGRSWCGERCMCRFHAHSVATVASGAAFISIPCHITSWKASLLHGEHGVSGLRPSGWHPPGGPPPGGLPVLCVTDFLGHNKSRSFLQLDSCQQSILNCMYGERGGHKPLALHNTTTSSARGCCFSANSRCCFTWSRRTSSAATMT